MSIRIVVADEAGALFYDIADRSALRSALHVSGQLTDPLAHLHERDLVSDKPGRKADRAPLHAGRRGATAHHATASEPQARRHETQQFVQRIGQSLADGVHAGGIDRLVLVCAPRFLGVLREGLPGAVSALVIHEIHKDLTHQPESALREHLTAEIEAGRLSLRPA
ncbi:MAG TPA: host attachment protein [Steroidobacteraceae bacterium]|nr:host attachment protein [Steroidobacteraceae bacterium]